MSGPGDAALDALLRELRREYVAQNAGRIAQLRAAAAAWRAGEDARVPVPLDMLLHQLAGSSGSYGFAELSQIARRGMQWVREASRAAPETGAALEALVGELVAALDAAARTEEGPAA